MGKWCFLVLQRQTRFLSKLILAKRQEIAARPNNLGTSPDSAPLLNLMLLNLLGLSNIHVLSCHCSLANTPPVERFPMWLLLWRLPDSQGGDLVFMESFTPPRLSSEKWFALRKQSSTCKSLLHFSILSESTCNSFDLPGGCNFLYCLHQPSEELPLFPETPFNILF